MRGLLLVLLGEWRRPCAGQGSPRSSPSVCQTKPNSATQYHTKLRHTMPNQTVPGYIMRRHLVCLLLRLPYHTIPSHTQSYHSMPCQISSVGAPHAPRCVSATTCYTFPAPLRGKLLVAASCEIQISIHRGPAMGTVDLQHILRFRIILCVVGGKSMIFWKFGTESSIVMWCLILG